MNITYDWRKKTKALTVTGYMFYPWCQIIQIGSYSNIEFQYH